MSGHERGRVRTQPHHRFGDFLGAAHATDRFKRGHLCGPVGTVIGQPAHHGRINRAGADGIHPDAGFGVFQGCGLGQAEHAMLAGHIGRAPAETEQPGG